MRPEGLARFSGAALPALLCYGILTVWVPGRWALGVYQAGALLLAAMWTLAMVARPFPVKTGVALTLLASAAAWGAVQLAAGITVARWETWNTALDWSTRAALFFVALQALGEDGPRRRFLNTLLYFAFALSAVSTLQMFTSGGKIFWLFPSGYEDLVLGPFVYRNQYAAFIETILPLAVYRAVRDRRGGFGYWAMAAVMVASVVAGASRAGSVLVLVEVAAVVALAWMQGMIPARAAGLALGQFALLAVVATSVVGWQYLWERFQQADPYAVRREMLESSLAMVRDRPWTGFGLGTWAAAYPKYALYDDGSFANQAHNDWAQWAVEGGIPLLAAMLALAGTLVAKAWRTVWGLGLVAVLVHALVDYPMQQRPALAGWFFAIAGAGLRGRALRASPRAAGGCELGAGQTGAPLCARPGNGEWISTRSSASPGRHRRRRSGKHTRRWRGWCIPTGARRRRSAQWRRSR